MKKRKPPDQEELDLDITERTEVDDVRKALSQAVGKIDPAELFERLTKAREQKDGLRLRSRTIVDSDAPMRRAADVSDKAIQVAPSPPPRGSRSFGSSQQFVKVTAKSPFPSATLRLKLDPKKIRHLQAATILMAQWNPETKRLHLIPQSGYNARLGYAIGRITEPGVYTAVGLPRDPRVLTTLELMRAMRRWLPLETQVAFLPKVCGLILCNPDVMNAFSAAAGQLGLDPNDFGGLPGGNLCEICLQGDRRFPELDLFETFDLDPGGLRPSVPPHFPAPCQKWESMGPDNISGRITALAFDPTDAKILYAGSAAGGVFKSTDSGTTWSTNWERELSLAIGGLAVAPSNRNVIYAATGEWDSTISAIYTMYPGAGVYKSDDAGARWRRLAPIPSVETSAVAVDFNNADRVYVAGNRGLHRSRDGGATWDVSPGRNYGVFDGPVADVVINPSNTNILYIGVHGSGPVAGGVYRSADGGDSWTLLTNGILSGPAVDAPKIALGRNGANGANFVAVKMSNLVFTSTDGGSTFTQAPVNPDFRTQIGGYMNVIAVDPTNESVLLAGDFNLFRSANGGVTWVNVSTANSGINRIHEDIQAIAIDPANHDRVFVGCDGGVYKSVDNGQNWITLQNAFGLPWSPIISNGLVTLQCWTVAVSQTSRMACAVTTHDNVTYAMMSAPVFNFLNYFFRGEGGWVEYDPKNPAVVYSDNWINNLVKTTNGDQWWQQQVWTDLGINTENLNAETFSIAWNDTERLLAIVGVNVQRSANGGTTWTTVLSVPGVQITAVQFAPSNDNHAYAASLDGRVWHSTDSGVTWTEIQRGGLPNQRVHDIEVDWNNPARVYLAFGTRGALSGIGYHPLWRGDVGAGNMASWFDISGGSPPVSLPDLGLTGLAIDPILRDTLYVCNIAGVYRTTDGGDSWHAFDEGLPNSFVSDLDIRKVDRTLWASTMGRGVFRRRL